MVQSSTKYRNILCHRDTWAGNILLDAKNSKVIVVDFQTCRYCPPAIDMFTTLPDRSRSTVCYKAINWSVTAVTVTILNVPKEIVYEDYKNVQRFTKFQKYMLECVQDIADYATVKRNLTTEQKINFNPNNTIIEIYVNVSKAARFFHFYYNRDFHRRHLKTFLFKSKPDKMALLHMKNAFICCHNEEILANYNEKEKTSFILQNYHLQPLTDLKDLLNQMQTWPSNYYRLTFRCIGKAEEGPQIALQERDNQSPCNYQVQFIVKRLPEDPEVTRDESRMIAFHKENNLYCALLPKMLDYSEKVWCPLLYLCRRHLLVLQDLNGLAYGVHDKETFSHSEMLNVLESLALMHSSSLAYEHFNKCTINDTCSYCLEEFLIGRDIPWFVAGIKALIEVAKIHPDYTGAWQKEFIENGLAEHLNQICSWLNASSIYRNVLCHGSPWVGNVLLNKRNPQAQAILVDFQNCHYCPPAIDVVFALFMNLTEEDRLAKEEIYLKHYYDALLQCLDHNKLCEVTVGMSENQFRQSYKDFQLFGLTFRALTATISKISPDYINGHYKYEDRATGVLDYMKKNESFQLLMFDYIKHIVDYVMPAQAAE